MRFGSMFSGIEAASVAWEPLGWSCRWVCEIEKFPCEVLARRYPTTPNLGDVTKVDWHGIKETKPVDTLIFGSPCQSFSFSGEQTGMDSPLGKLALFGLEVVNILRPTWFIFENVPGILSARNGRDFGSMLGTLGKFGYGFAYRVLDAQYFGTPQRRRRVFLVGHSSGQWQRAAAVLFEPESLSGHRPSRPYVRKGTATDYSESLEDDRGVPLRANCLTRRMYKGVNTACDEGQTLIPVGERIRKLTPLEAERLQGLPDNWTLLRATERGDRSRYKAIGNSMHVPTIRWLGQRIQMVHNS